MKVSGTKHTTCWLKLWVTVLNLFVLNGEHSYRLTELYRPALLGPIRQSSNQTLGLNTLNCFPHMLSVGFVWVLCFSCELFTGYIFIVVGIPIFYLFLFYLMFWKDAES